MKVRVHIFAEGEYGRIYTVSRYNLANEEIADSETRLFIDAHIGGILEDEALDLEGKLEVMVEKFGIEDEYFRHEGTRYNRPNLLGIPGSDEKHRRLRMYGYKKSNELLLIGGGCHKWHDESGKKTSLDDFSECRKSADFIMAVNIVIERKKDNGTLRIRANGFYDDKNNLLREFELTIADSLT